MAVLVHDANDAVVVELANSSFHALGTRVGAGECTLCAGGECQTRLSQVPCYPLAWPGQHILHDTPDNIFMSTSVKSGTRIR